MNSLETAILLRANFLEQRNNFRKLASTAKASGDTVSLETFRREAAEYNTKLKHLNEHIAFLCSEVFLKNQKLKKAWGAAEFEAAENIDQYIQNGS